MMTMAITISVVWVVSARVGQTTLRNSVREPWINSKVSAPKWVLMAIATATPVATSKPITLNSKD
jgi:hypothetical protein